MLDIERLYRDLGIPYDTRQNPGWININCPFCLDAGRNLGFNLAGGYFHCWRCGGHPLETTLRALFRLTPEACHELLAQYTVEGQIRARLNQRKIPKASSLELPGGQLNPGERKYLRSRGFNPDHLVRKYMLRGGGVVGKWRYRIIIPLIFGGRIVSFTSRDITGLSPRRYMNLSVEQSVMDPKSVLYNLDNATGRRVCLVEGPADVWRMGDGFVCSFGTDVTQAQVRLLSRYKEVFIMFDPEPEARIKARKVAEELSILGGGTDVWLVDMEEYRCDPGDLTEEQAQKLRRELGI